MALSVAEILASPKAQTRALILTGVVGGVQMGDPVVASLALPKAGRDLDMDAPQLALASSVSTLFLAATVVLIGALAERYGRRQVLMVTLLMTIVGDLIVFLAPSSAVFMLGRAVAGAAVGGALACSYAYVRVISPDERLGRALGLWAAVSGITAVPMSLVGAGVANVDWRLAFLVTPITSAACLLLVPKLLPKVAPVEERRQLWGVTIAGLGLVGILYGVSQAANQLVQPKVYLPIATGILLLGLAAVIGLRSQHPSYPVRVFKDPGMLTAVLAGAMWNMILAVAVLQSSNLWQYVDAVAPFSVSVLQLPANVAVAVASLLTGRLMSKQFDFRVLMFSGFAIAALGFVFMGVTGSGAVSVGFTLALTGAGFGAGAAGCVQSQVLLDAAPAGYLGAVAASRTTFGQVGYAIGLAGSVVVTSLVTISTLAGALGESSDAARNSYSEWLTADHSGTVGGAVSDAYQSAFSTSMFFWAGVTLVVAAVCAVLLTLSQRHRKPVDEPLAQGPVAV